VEHEIEFRRDRSNERAKRVRVGRIGRARRWSATGNIGQPDGANHVFEPASGTQRLAEPVQTQRTLGPLARRTGHDAEGVVNRQRAHAVALRVGIGDHRAAGRGERRSINHVPLDARRQRIRRLAARTAVFTRVKIFEVDPVRTPSRRADSATAASAPVDPP